MTDTFEDLKLVPELAAGAESMGWDAPSGLQRDAVAKIRRGNNVVLHASAGSGHVGAYGLGVLDRLAREEEREAPAGLVLVADPHTASATAESLALLAAPAGLSVRALGPGWGDGADLLVASADRALAAVRSSDLKLDGVTSLIIDGADLLLDTGQWAALETLADATSGQRVVVTGRFDATIDAFIEGHARKAMTVPPRTEPGSPPADAPSVHYAVAPEAEKVGAAVELLAGLGDGVAVICRTVDRADRAERALAARGVAGPDRDLLVLPRPEADQRSVQASVVSLDVPFDADEIRALHGKGGAVVVTPRERAHLLRIAARAGIRLQAAATATPARTEVAAVRDRLRALASGDLTAELALLEPLLGERPAAEVAAAAVRLARESGGAEASEPARSGGAAGAPPPETGTWVHLFMDIGDRDDVGPGDIVGAITGEAGVSGDQVGKIDIRESHSTVEVATSVASTVIEALNGRTLKGRSLRVDYDRKGRTSRGREGRRP
jgi:ATP-dependent RNA helicase DeaD